MKKEDRKGKKQQVKQKHSAPDAPGKDPQMEINITNSGAGQPHNASKEGLGPNTNR